jgi:hypothetical protein
MERIRDDEEVTWLNSNDGFLAGEALSYTHVLCDLASRTAILFKGIAEDAS